MPEPSFSRSMKSSALIAAAAVILAMLLSGRHTVTAFPPAPHTTFYGLVRGTFGFALDDGQTDLLLLADGEEIARTAIRDTGDFNENFRLEVPVDLAPSRGVYRLGTISGDTAIEYMLVAERNGTRIPVTNISQPEEETITPQSAGAIRLDLILAEDSDGDGLPDDWERFQVRAADGDPMSNLLDFLSRDGDYDGDELSDWEEYVAGTFALLNSDHLHFRLLEVGEETATLTFLAVDGKSYRIQSSDDAKNWDTLPFETVEDVPKILSVFRADDTRMESVRVSATLVRKFFQLQVN